MIRKNRIVRVSRAGLIATFIFLAVPAIAEELFSSHVDESGNISLPDDFRSNMAHMGSWFVPDGDASGFHDVYTEKASIESFRKTGKFPDGTTIVKELRASHAGDYTTGKGVQSATGVIKQWFVMVKDQNGRFPKSPTWGEGWGWALFKPDDRSANVATNYQTDCLGCHVPAKAQNWIYTDAYPTLKAQ